MVVLVVDSADQGIRVDFDLVLLEQVVYISAWLLLSTLAQHHEHWAPIIDVALKGLELRFSEGLFGAAKYNELGLWDASIDLLFI